MNNRLIIFIVMVVLATLTAFAQQNDQLISVTERNLPAPTIIEQSQPSEMVSPVKDQLVSVTERELSAPAAQPETVRTLTVPTPPVMQVVKISAPEESSVAPTTQTENNGINIGLSAEVRQKGASLLNRLLSDEYVLYTKTLKFHWNVQGIVFHDFHAAFKEQYEKLFEIVDNIAERARALGAPALGTLQEFSTYSRLKEISNQKLSAIDMIKQLLADHEAVIRTIRMDIDETAKLGDQGTSNFLQDLIIKHEKIAWMLRATAQNNGQK